MQTFNEGAYVVPVGDDEVGVGIDSAGNALVGTRNRSCVLVKSEVGDYRIQFMAQVSLDLDVTNLEVIGEEHVHDRVLELLHDIAVQAVRRARVLCTPYSGEWLTHCQSRVLAAQEELDRCKQEYRGFLDDLAESNQ